MDQNRDRDEELRSIRETAERMAERMNMRFVLSADKLKTFSADEEGDDNEPDGSAMNHGPQLNV